MLETPCVIGCRRLIRGRLRPSILLLSLCLQTLAARAHEGDLDHPDYDRAQELLEQGVWMEATDRLTAHVTDHPDDAVARMQLATLLFQLNRDRAAADHASVVYAKHPAHAEARRLLIRIRSRLAQAMDPQNPDDLLHFARLARLLGNIDRSADAFRESLALKADPDVLLELARMYHWSERLPEAAGPYRDYLMARPGDYRVRQELGRLLNAAHRHADAVAEYRLALDQVGRDPELEMEYGRSLFWNDETDEAMEVFERILRLQPANIPARLQRAAVLHARERFTEADAEYREILRMQPDQLEAAYRVFEYEQNRVLDIERYRAWLVQEPADVETRRILIQTLTERERWADAAYEMQTFLLLHPDDADMRAQMDALQTQRRERLMGRLTQLRRARERLHDPVLRRYEVWLRYHANDEQARWRWAHHLQHAGQRAEALMVLRAWPAEVLPPVVREMITNIRSVEGGRPWREN